MMLLNRTIKRRNKLVKRLAVFIFCSLLASASSSAIEFPVNNIMLVSLPPYNYVDNGEKKGIAVELLNNIIRASGYSLNKRKIHPVPLARALFTLNRIPGSMLTSIARTPEREGLYQWVGPIDTVYIDAIAMKRSNIKINSPLDINQYKLGTMINSAPKEFLIRAGVDYKKSEKVPYHEQNIKQLISGRVDLIFYCSVMNTFSVKEMGLNPNDFEKVYRFAELGIYYAFDKTVDKAVIDRLNQELQKFKQAKGADKSPYDVLKEKYLGQWH